ncbi:MAG: ABC transporter permease [Christensenellales bacterium]|jgi:putative aldouronate transport system permease protein
MSNHILPHNFPNAHHRTRLQKLLGLIWRQRALLLLSLIPVALLIIFQYVPMYGVLIAFKKYKASRGVWASPWLEPWYQNFAEFFSNVNCAKIITQTIKVGIFSLIFTYPMPIILALMLNEVKNNAFKRTVQSISYIPHFISVVVICSMLNTFGSLDGLFNNIREALGMTRVNMNADSRFFMPMYIGSAIWQGMGWGSIIYLSALSNVDTSLYDVANIDGANRFQKIQHIALPAILPTTTVVLILNAGNILTQDYTKILLMMNSTNKTDLNVISTYVYEIGIANGRFSYATAVNLLVSVVSLILVVGTNTIVGKIDPDQGLW